MQTIKRPLLSTTTSKQILRFATVNHAVNTNNSSIPDIKSWKKIPGPTSLPFFGKLLQFLPGATDALSKPDVNFAAELYKQYGPIVKLDGVFGSPTFVFLFDAEAAEHVLRSEDHIPIRPGFQSLVYFRNQKKPKDEPDCPTGLISDQGATWKKFRSKVNSIMLQPKTIRLYKTTLEEVADDMIVRMRSKRNEKNMLEGKFDVEMNLWALESIGVVALGGRINCFDSNLLEDSPAKKMIHVVHEIFEIATKLDFRPNLSKFFATPLFKRAMRVYEEQLKLKKYFISKAVEELKHKNKSNDEKGVLEKLLEVDVNIAEIMASDMLLAGIDTAANTITATLYLLATNQDKQDKLRKEILSNAEKKPYLKACIKESMRILPVASANLRQTTKDYNLLGYNVPKGCHVVLSHQSLSLMEQHFPQPKEYIPERWIADKSDPLYYGNAHPFAYMPFGFGTRSCIGRRIAQLEIETFLSKVIQNFHVEWFGEKMHVQQKSLNYMIGPYNFIFKDV